MVPHIFLCQCQRLIKGFNEQRVFFLLAAIMQLVLMREPMHRVISNYRLPGIADFDLQLNDKPDDLILNLLMLVTDATIGLQNVQKRRRSC